MTNAGMPIKIQIKITNALLHAVVSERKHPRAYRVTDGYQVYHKVEKEREDLRIAGCWVHYPRSIIILEEMQISA